MEKSYLVVSTAQTVASDGTSQPAGTAFNRVMWDGVTPFDPGRNMELIRDDGRALYQPAFVGTP